MYHAPTDCATIRKWLTKCADDSETANYISAHTKDVSKFTNTNLNTSAYAYTCTYTLKVIRLDYFYCVNAAGIELF